MFTLALIGLKVFKRNLLILIKIFFFLNEKKRLKRMLRQKIEMNYQGDEIKNILSYQFFAKNSQNFVNVFLLNAAQIKLWCTNYKSYN